MFNVAGISVQINRGRVQHGAKKKTEVKTPLQGRAVQNSELRR
jgi:hypothetical protein